jgi:hypothetical protein
MPHTSTVHTQRHKLVVGRGFRKRCSVSGTGIAPLRRDQRSHLVQVQAPCCGRGATCSAATAAQTRAMTSAAVSRRAGSMMAGLPWPQRGSMAVSQGLVTGRRQGRSRPPPARLTRCWCGRLQGRTARRIGPAAFAQTRARPRFCPRARRAQTQASTAVVPWLPGRPSTTRRQTAVVSGRRRPEQATALGAGAPSGRPGSRRRSGLSAVQLCRAGGASRLHQRSSPQPTTPSAGWGARRSSRARGVL